LGRVRGADAARGAPPGEPGHRIAPRTDPDRARAALALADTQAVAAHGAVAGALLPARARSGEDAAGRGRGGAGNARAAVALPHQPADPPADQPRRTRRARPAAADGRSGDSATCDERFSES